jgi:hypothetical protein
MLHLKLIALDLALTLLAGAGGIVIAWALRRYSTLSARNLYGPAIVLASVFMIAAAMRFWTVALVLMPFAALSVVGGSFGRRWRVSDLGAGEELRNHELARRWIWQPAPARSDGGRVYLRGQGELVRERPWPNDVQYISMTASRKSGPRLPLGDGHHIALFGATGAGKTTTARRLIAARTLAQHAALLVLDQKGDDEDVRQMQSLAAVAGVPFILFDSQDPDTDRWQPLWGTPDAVAARCVEPVRESEPYYYDALRRHLDIVCKVLYASERWPPSVPFLIDCCQPLRYPAVLAIATGLPAKHAPLIRRATEHGRYVQTPQGFKDLVGGANRLEVALSLAGRKLVTPRESSGGETVAVRLVEALKERAVVMWRTHADTMPDEATALSVLALADLHDAAAQAGVPWTLLLDEFGAVIKMAAQRCVAILQRGRSHHGQVVVITQSAADIEALSAQPGLLASLTDNFSGIVAHRQTSPESRDWLAKLMGTRALWQNTQATTGGQYCGRGSARRVREFRIGSDVFSSLSRGQAVIYTPVAGDPVVADVAPFILAQQAPRRIDQTAERHACEVTVNPEDRLPDLVAPGTSNTDQVTTDEQVDPSDW